MFEVNEEHTVIHYCTSIPFERKYSYNKKYKKGNAIAHNDCKERHVLGVFLELSLLNCTENDGRTLTYPWDLLRTYSDLDGVIVQKQQNHPIFILIQV